MSWLGYLLTRLRGDLPWYVAIWVLVLAALIAVDLIEGGTFDLSAIVVGWFLWAVALTPLAWLRWATPVLSGRHATRRTLAVIGLAAVWAAVVLLLGATTFGALGIEW